jgi:prepilin-type N-terminal cleavage/methylation domain-containing protein
MKSKHKTAPARLNNNRGFTLIELMVTMAISVILLAGIYAAYQAQLRSHVTQQVVVDIQQNLRSSMHYLQRSIRMAGFGAGAGFVDDFSAYADYDNPDVSRDATSIAFTMDADDDGVIGNDGNVDNELIAFRLNGTVLEKFRPSAHKAGVPDPWFAVAENIQSINFVYLDDAMNPGAALADIRSVQIKITAQPVEAIYMRASEKRPQVLSVQLRCRNL